MSCAKSKIRFGCAFVQFYQDPLCSSIYYTVTVFILLTHLRLNKQLHTIYWKSQTSIFLYVSLCDLDIPGEKMLKFFADSAMLSFCGVLSGSSKFAKSLQTKMC